MLNFSPRNRRETNAMQSTPVDKFMAAISLGEKFSTRKVLGFILMAISVVLVVI